MNSPLGDMTEALSRAVDARVSLSDVLRERIEQAGSTVDKQREGREVEPSDGATPAQ